MKIINIKTSKIIIKKIINKSKNSKFKIINFIREKK